VSLLTLTDFKPRNPWLALAIDEAVCQYFANREFDGLIRLWTNPHAICLGRICEVSKNVPEHLRDMPASARKSVWKNRVSLLRRASGGGTVLHGPGNWNYSIALSLEKYPQIFPVKPSYEIFLGFVSRALARQNVETRFAGQSDLVIVTPAGERKISGNSQFRKRRICVHHGTLLHDMEFVLRIAEILPHPPKEPGYREHRAHADFLGSLPFGFSIPVFFYDLGREVAPFLGNGKIEALSGHDRKMIFQLARELAKKIYTKSDWILEGRMADAHRDQTTP